MLTKLPLGICFFTGMLLICQYYVPHPASVEFLTRANDWFLIVGAFALVLGFLSVLKMHWGKIRRQAPGWGYSLFMFAGIAIGAGAGLVSGGRETTAAGALTFFGWVYQYMLGPLQGTMFSILAFYVVSAAFRAFRVKSAEAAVLLGAAALLIFGSVPLGQYLAQAALGPNFSIAALVEWVMDVPSMAARRGILLGVSLGMLAMSLKIILGVEKQYLGGSRSSGHD